MLQEMDDEFGVSNVINEALGDMSRVKVKKEPVSVQPHVIDFYYVISTTNVAAGPACPALASSAISVHAVDVDSPLHESSFVKPCNCDDGQYCCTTERKFSITASTEEKQYS